MLHYKTELETKFLLINQRMDDKTDTTSVASVWYGRVGLIRRSICSFEVATEVVRNILFFSCSLGAAVVIHNIELSSIYSQLRYNTLCSFQFRDRLLPPNMWRRHGVSA